MKKTVEDGVRKTVICCDMPSCKNEVVSEIQPDGWHWLMTSLPGPKDSGHNWRVDICPEHAENVFGYLGVKMPARTG